MAAAPAIDELTLANDFAPVARGKTELLPRSKR